MIGPLGTNCPESVVYEHSLNHVSYLRLRFLSDFVLAILITVIKPVNYRYNTSDCAFYTPGFFSGGGGKI